MMSTKMATLGLLKKRYKDYDVIVSFYDVINKMLSRDSDYIVNVVV